MKKQDKKPMGTSLLNLLKPYKGIILLLTLLTIAASGLSLVIPKIVSSGIDSYTAGEFNYRLIVIQFLTVTGLIGLFTYFQIYVQTYASEKVAYDLRTQTAHAISKQSYAYTQKVGPNRLLTNLTSDADAVKTFVSQGVATIVSSILLIIAISVLLLLTNWKLALLVLLIIPAIGITFGVIFFRVRVLFLKSREIIDRLNKVINESILGSTLIRVLNSQVQEEQKFTQVNTEAQSTSISISRLFASLIPTVVFIGSLGSLVVLVVGGKFVIQETMSLGEFTAFSTYIGILIFPIIILGFTSTLIAQASASYTRIKEVLDEKIPKDGGDIEKEIQGNVSVQNVSLSFGEKFALKNVSFEIKAGTRNAIIGPTAAGKTQLLYLLSGLVGPESGKITYDLIDIKAYARDSLHAQIGLVFQDSAMFNLTLRENIEFNEGVSEEDFNKAVSTAELNDFISTLPQGLDTIVYERGTSLSGGQKQRIMLARALALNPRILLLDDFTARVDPQTEQKITKNISQNYPNLTLISVTQKISSVENYDQIILLMQGEILASGTHNTLIETSPEYVQIYNSQKSTNDYGLHAK